MSVSALLLRLHYNSTQKKLILNDIIIVMTMIVIIVAFIMLIAVLGSGNAKRTRNPLMKLKQRIK